MITVTNEVWTEEQVQQVNDFVANLEKPEITYKIGQVFDVDSSVCILARVDYDKINFILLSDGNRYFNSVSSRDIGKITSDTLKHLCQGREDFQLISDSVQDYYYEFYYGER